MSVNNIIINGLKENNVEFVTTVPCKQLAGVIEILENSLGVSAQKILKPMQKGDVKYTFADISKLNDWVGYEPKTSFEKGIKIFSEWFLDYFKKN